MSNGYIIGMDLANDPGVGVTYTFRCSKCDHTEETARQFEACPKCGAGGWSLIHTGPVIEGAEIPLPPRLAGATPAQGDEEAQIRASIDRTAGHEQECAIWIPGGECTCPAPDGLGSPTKWRGPGSAPPNVAGLLPGCAAVGRVVTGEHLQHLAEPLIDFVQSIAERTGRVGVTRISLTPDLGLSFGIAPGTSIDVATSVGRVEVYAERTPRLQGVVRIEEP